MAEASQTASFPRRCGTRGLIFLSGTGGTVPGGPTPHGPYTPAVRRWFCIVALLAGFSGDGYAWTVRPRVPIPMERVLDPRRWDPGLPEVAWWRLS